MSPLTTTVIVTRWYTSSIYIESLVSFTAERVLKRHACEVMIFSAGDF